MLRKPPRCPLGFTLTIAVAATASLCLAQANPSLQAYFRDYVGLTDQQIASIRGDQAVTKVLPSRTPAEIFVFGAVHIDSAPEKYLELSRDFERLRAVPGYLAILLRSPISTGSLLTVTKSTC